MVASRKLLPVSWNGGKGTPLPPLRFFRTACSGSLLFFLLAIGDYISAGPDFKHLTGYEGIFCGFSAIYAGLAQVLNEVFGKVVLPLGAVTK